MLCRPLRFLTLHSSDPVSRYRSTDQRVCGRNVSNPARSGVSSRRSWTTLHRTEQREGAILAAAYSHAIHDERP